MRFLKFIEEQRLNKKLIAVMILYGFNKKPKQILWARLGLDIEKP